MKRITASGIMASIAVLGVLLVVYWSSDPGVWPEADVPAHIYARDSTYVAYAAEHKEISGYSHVDSSRAHVDALLYSPDSLKLFAAVIERVRFKPRPPGRPDGWTTYSGRGVAGYRSSTSEPWKLYTHRGFAAGADSYDETSEHLRHYFLRSIAWHRLNVLDPDGGKRLMRMRYTVDDPRYWEGPVWQKGIRMPDRYLFEAVESGNPQRGEFRPLGHYKVAFPDSLLKQFE